MTQQTLYIILQLSPLAIGGIIAAVNGETVNNATEKAESWTRKSQSKLSSKNDLLSRFILNPNFSVNCKVL